MHMMSRDFLLALSSDRPYLYIFENPVRWSLSYLLRDSLKGTSQRVRDSVCQTFGLFFPLYYRFLDRLFVDDYNW